MFPAENLKKLLPYLPKKIFAPMFKEVRFVIPVFAPMLNWLDFVVFIEDIFFEFEYDAENKSLKKSTSN